MKSLPLFCSKCRDRLQHQIASFKVDRSQYQQIEVLNRVQDGKYLCRCLACGHTWVSKSKSKSKSAQVIVSVTQS